MAITSKEIAELAGVSRGTVDRALKGERRRKSQNQGKNTKNRRGEQL